MAALHENEPLTLRLYRVVVPTASVPFLIALAVKWFRTT
jgi:hypothetical protein